MIFDWCFKCDTKHDLDEPCEGIMNTITTNTEATDALRLIDRIERGL